MRFYRVPPITNQRWFETTYNLAGWLEVAFSKFSSRPHDSHTPLPFVAVEKPYCCLPTLASCPFLIGFRAKFGVSHSADL